MAGARFTIRLFSRTGSADVAAAIGSANPAGAIGNTRTFVFFALPIHAGLGGETPRATKSAATIGATFETIALRNAGLVRVLALARHTRLGC